MSTRGDVTYRATDDGAMVEERLDIDAETSLSLIRTRRVPTQPNQVASTPRGESSEEKAEEQAERQAVTHAAQLAVEEEKLLKGLELLNTRREETQHKLEDNEEQLKALNDPARGHELQDLQMKSARAERVQFEKSQEASDFKLEAERHLEQAKDKGLIKQAAQAKLDGVDRPELGIVIDGDVTQENVDQLAKVEHVLSDQAAEAGAKADIAEASMHVAEDEYNDAQAKIAKIESDVPAYGKEKVEEMLKLNCDKVEDLDRAIAALEDKCEEATQRSQQAQKEAVELLRSREKRKEANKRAAAATSHARDQEAAAQEAAKQRKEQNDKAESDRQAAALERRQQMVEREAELSKQAEEQRRALQEEFQAQEHYEPISTARDVARNELGLTPREAITMNTRRTTPSRQARAPPQPPPAREQPQQAVIGKDTNIGVWLRSMRMAQYEEQFLAWGMSTLGKLIDNSEWLTESDLKEMGVVLAHRKSILQCIRAVAAIMNKAGSDTPVAETPAGGRATPRAVCKTSAAVPLTQEQTTVLKEMFEAYAPTGELSEMGFSSLFLEAMAYSLLSKECLSVTAPHVRRWVRNRELSEGIDMSSNLVLKRLFDFVDSERTGSISLESAQAGISQMWAGAADGWQYLHFLTTAGDDLEASAICEFVISLCRFTVELATNVTVLERCHLEANGMPTDRAAQKLKELKKELNTTEGALKRHSDAIMRILGRGRDGELPAPYRRLDELIKSMLSQDPSVIHAPISNAPATPRGQKPKRAKNPTSNNNAFTDTVNTMLENRLAEVEKERATRKGQRDQNKQVNSPRCRLMPISVKLRRNTGKLDQKVIECAGITTEQLIADMNKKLGFQFSKLYSMMGVEVNPHSIARSMELVASAGDPFIHPEAPAGPPKSILQSAALHGSAPMNSPRCGSSPSRIRPGQASPARNRKSESSPARVRTPRAVSGGIQIVFTASQADEGSESSALPPTPSRREPKSVRKAPLPAVFGGGGRTPRDASPGPADRPPPPPPPPLPESARNEAGSATDPSPLAAPVPRSAIRWASAARLQPGEWSDSRNIRRGVTMGRAS